MCQVKGSGVGGYEGYERGDVSSNTFCWIYV